MTQVNTFTPAQSAHYFRINSMYGVSPFGIRAMHRLFKAARKPWFSVAPELTCEGPLEQSMRIRTKVMIPDYGAHR